MIKFQDMKRMLTTAKYIARENGLRGVYSAVRQRIALARQLSLSRNIESVEIDGCIFDIAGLPNLPIKAALLDGTYEGPERAAVARYIRPELPVVELGACLGVVSCITNRLLSNPAAHLVVETNPNVLSHLQRNRATNCCGFEIVNAAIAYGQASVSFIPSADFWGSSLVSVNGGEPVTVKTAQLGDLVSRRKFDSFTLICDIEGYEYDLVRNEAETLRSADTIILETHARIIGEQKTTEMLSALQSLGFRTVQKDTFVYVLRR